MIVIAIYFSAGIKFSVAFSEQESNHSCSFQAMVLVNYKMKKEKWQLEKVNDHEG